MEVSKLIKLFKIIRGYEIENKEGVSMDLGFILIKAAPNYEHKVFNQLSEISEIVKLHPVSGEYDLIAQVEIDSYDKLKSIAENKIKLIDGVLRTKIVTEPKF